MLYFTMSIFGDIWNVEITTMNGIRDSVLYIFFSLLE